MQEITIIYPPTVDWYFLFQRPQQMLKHMAKLPGVRCIYISPQTYKTLPTPIVKIDEDMFVVSAYVNYESLVRGKKVMWFSYPPTHVYAQRADFAVFDAIDNPTDEFSFWKRDLAASVKAANVIVSSADIMHKDHTEHSGKPTYLIPNGADYPHFKAAEDKLPIPADFPRFENGDKIIGFYGALATWVDYKIIEKLAEKFNVVLIGKNQFYNYQPLNLKGRIAVVDHKDYSVLPSYLSQFDLTVIPFKLSEMIKGCDPIKFYEFLSAGKPVLATEMDELEKYSDVTYFINMENCIDVAQKAIAEDSPELRAARQKVAYENSWEVRAKAAVNAIRANIG